MTAFYAGQLLGFTKTAVRSYAIGITETATPQVRETLQKQLNAAITIFNFMLERGLYDVAMANKALSL